MQKSFKFQQTEAKKSITFQVLSTEHLVLKLLAKMNDTNINQIAAQLITYGLENLDEETKNNIKEIIK